MKCKICGKEVYKVYQGRYEHFEEKFNIHEIVLEEKK